MPRDSSTVQEYRPIDELDHIEPADVCQQEQVFED